MTRLTSFPINLFTSQRKFNDYNADDMKCGDLTEYQLKIHILFMTYQI